MQRRRQAKLPERIQFATKSQIALERIRAAKRRGLAPGIVLADGYGRDTAFREVLEVLGHRTPCIALTLRAPSVIVVLSAVQPPAFSIQFMPASCPPLRTHPGPRLASPRLKDFQASHSEVQPALSAMLRTTDQDLIVRRASTIAIDIPYCSS
jgi:hypothetical protein